MAVHALFVTQKTKDKLRSEGGNEDVENVSDIRVDRFVYLQPV